MSTTVNHILMLVHGLKKETFIHLPWMKLIFGFSDQHLGDIMDFIETEKLKISVKDNRIISAMMQINDDFIPQAKTFDMVYSYASEKNYIRVILLFS